MFVDFEHAFLGYPVPDTLKDYKQEIEETAEAIANFDEKKLQLYIREWDDFYDYVDVDGRGGHDAMPLDPDVIITAIYAACEGANFHKFAGAKGKHWTDNFKELVYPKYNLRDLHYARGSRNLNDTPPGSDASL